MNNEIIKFHLYSLRFTPYSHLTDEYNSDKILNEVITYLTKELLKGKGHLIDRHRNRKNENPRELFLISAVFKPVQRRIMCSIALLRSGRTPKIKPIDEFRLLPIKTIGDIAEETNFYIDYSRNYAVVCIEYNHNGPRMKDVEYYLRNVARDVLKLSKITDVNLYMSNTIDKTLASLKNVLSMDIKIQPRKLAKMDTDLVGKYFTEINSFGNKLKPKYIKIEALYQTPGKNVTSSEFNKEATSMVKDLVGKFKSRPFNIDCFDNFVVKYEDNEGEEHFFNLLKGKAEIVKEVDMSTLTNRRKWYKLIEVEFDEFMVNFGIE
jgi:hypothetical protein